MRGRDRCVHVGVTAALVAVALVAVALTGCSRGSSTATGTASTTVAVSTKAGSTPTVSPEEFRCATTLEGLVFAYLNGPRDPKTFTAEFGAASPLIQPLVQAASATADERTEHGMAAGLRVTQYAVGQLCGQAATLAEVLHRPSTTS